MKDSQLPAMGLVDLAKYIKANNERFSTMDPIERYGI